MQGAVETNRSGSSEKECCDTNICCAQSWKHLSKFHHTCLKDGALFTGTAVALSEACSAFSICVACAVRAVDPGSNCEAVNLM